MGIGPFGLCAREPAAAPAEAPSRLARKEVSDSGCSNCAGSWASKLTQWGG